MIDPKWKLVCILHGNHYYWKNIQGYYNISVDGEPPATWQGYWTLEYVMKLNGDFPQ